ncbi:MAG: tol-pal system-associated acyl-CoA thioesterase [Pseudomonadota bacterium]|nr:tol-pal system-associated acyl-CoA thioesterase [Pseudomonadota bacterium]
MAELTPFSWRLRVYWEDTDAAGIVFYANYLKFFERARTEWLRQRGLGQEALRTGSRIGFVVTESSLRYRSPARLDDEIDVSVVIGHVGQASASIVQEARRADALLAEGRIRIGCVDLATFRPRRFPDDVLAAFR